MSCTTCTKTKPIPQCSGILTLGAVDITEGIAIVREVITGRIRKTAAVTIALGIASVDLSTFGAFLSPNFLYSITLYDDSVSNYNDPAPVTIDAVEYDCFQLSFDQIVDVADGEIDGAETFVLSVYE